MPLSEHARSRLRKIHSKAGEEFVGHEMHKFKHGTLHSTSKHGPIVHSQSQAIAIALEQAREKGYS